ncbi:MAG TPA: flippase [Steroidobacteraceae bacterium]|nr:flippase [Steroidobacteraceae bacterium]
MSVTRNTLYNLAGSLVPLLVALVTIPLYIHQIGAARYGVMAIVWVLLGYFGLLDLGLSRATSNQIAQLHEGPARDRAEVFWTACLMNSALGMFGGLMLYLIGRPLLGGWLKMSPELHSEALAVLPWISASVPVATVTGVLAGALEGRRLFGTLNVLQAAGTILFQAVPLAAAFLISPKLQVIVPVAVLVRAVSSLPLAWTAKTSLDLRYPRIRVGHMKRLLAYGTWVTLTNLLTPFLESLDRFFIGIVISAPAVAYYAVPFSLVSRTQVLPKALSRTIFPYLSAENPQQARNRALESVITLAATMIPIAVLTMFLLQPFLRVWVGAGFAARAAVVGETLLCGIWLNGLASVPYAMLQAQGRPDIVAKFHVAELLPYVALLWFGLHEFGLVGAAAAWALRVAMDALLLFWAANLGLELVKRLVPGALLVFCAWVCVRIIPATFYSARAAAGVLLIVTAGAWCLHTSARVRREVTRVLRYVQAS